MKFKIYPTQVLHLLEGSDWDIKKIPLRKIITWLPPLVKPDFKWAFPFNFTVLRNWTICSNDAQKFLQKFSYLLYLSRVMHACNTRQYPEHSAWESAMGWKGSAWLPTHKKQVLLDGTDKRTLILSKAMDAISNAGFVFSYHDMNCRLVRRDTTNSDTKRLLCTGKDSEPVCSVDNHWCVQIARSVTQWCFCLSHFHVTW